MIDLINRTIRAVTAPMKRRIDMVIRRSTVGRSDDGQNMQEMQAEIFADEVKDGVERFQPYGFTSNPDDGAEAIVAALGGNTDHTVILVVDDRRVRLKGLEKGEVAVYHKSGSKVHMKNDGSIVILQADAGLVEIGGEPAADFVALQKLVEARWDVLSAAMVAFVPGAPDGGAALSVAISGAIETMGPVGAEKVKAT